MNALIEVRNLEKRFKGRKAIDDLSFSVYPGEILCLLGPNGAGKSTTIKALAGAIGCEAGTITYKGRPLGKNDRAFKKNLGIVPQDIALYEDLSAERNARFFCSLYGVRGRELDEKTKGALEFAGLSDRAKEKVGEFSGGMKRRLNIACGIAHDPELVIMDEPTVGVDPQSRNHILASVRELRDAGKTIVYTTHYMEEVEEISTRILIMDHGRIIAGGTKEEIKERVAGDRELTVEYESAVPVAPEDFLNVEGVREAIPVKGGMRITSDARSENLDRVIAVLMAARAKISNVTCEAASVETAFLRLTGTSLRD
jgi:ABC-2 type transport system ATP-binding protein